CISAEQTNSCTNLYVALPISIIYLYHCCFSRINCCWYITGDCGRFTGLHWLGGSAYYGICIGLCNCWSSAIISHRKNGKKKAVYDYINHIFLRKYDDLFKPKLYIHDGRPGDYSDECRTCHRPSTHHHCQGSTARASRKITWLHLHGN